MSTPSAPIIRNAPRASPNTLEYYWFTPATDGGSPITGYQINLEPGTIRCNILTSELPATFGTLPDVNTSSGNNLYIVKYAA